MPDLKEYILAVFAMILVGIIFLIIATSVLGWVVQYVN